MESSNNVVIDNYIQKSMNNDIDSQIECVRYFISYFKLTDKLKVDETFLKFFPDNLFRLFSSMSEDRTNVDNYDEMVFLLFNIFIFIYRNHNCVGDPKTRSFVNIFLKLIKNRDKHEAFPIEELLGFHQHLSVI
ncbi:hypothetical protein RF11_13045 [Thelohanellus kitauei]|uniref:Uncharacterized protein n=1 Tax=Thelohanellus kitauei TaxID=669202 RepID=A0A0C2M858_THEKT|nr:hypothetical protein RF11_13045 [Thelohanellus kitauei]